jgi:truncated hemoglobin YjbI
MPSPDLCSEEEVHFLVHDFYARVRGDATLGPIFDTHVHERANELAHRIAESLWYGWQMSRRDGLPQGL